MTAIPHFQPGFRLMDGTAMNAIVDEVNSLSGGGTPGPITGTTGLFSGTVTVPNIAGSDASLDIVGFAAAQGGAVVTTGGTSSTSANAGGAASQVGGTPGATGVGGASRVIGGAGGATSGDGGAAVVTGGAGTAGNGNGGSVVLSGGAKNGTGIAGGVRAEGLLIRSQGAPAAKTVSATLTAAELTSGIITVTQGAGAASAQQSPTGTAILAGLPADFAVGDSFDVSIINLGAASEVASLTVNTDVTIVGNAAIPVPATGVQSTGVFRFRMTAAHVFVAYRIG